jgi:hypothetical protein
MHLEIIISRTWYCFLMDGNPLDVNVKKKITMYMKGYS